MSSTIRDGEYDPYVAHTEDPVRVDCHRNDHDHSASARDSSARDTSALSDTTRDDEIARAAEKDIAGTAAPVVQPSRRAGMFASLAVRNYRYYFAGQVVSNTGTWMQRIAQDWLVLNLTGSSFAVGITIAMQFLPVLLFGLYGGVIADRFGKRQLLMLTQSCMGVLAGVLAILTLTGSVHVWHVYLLACLLGLVTAVDSPSRQTFVAEMVGQEQLRNAVSLNAVNFETASMTGPAVAGAVIAAVGTGWAFAINAFSFIAVVGGLLLMRPAQLRPVPRVPRQKGQLREGLRYVAARPDLIGPLVLVGFVCTFGYNFPTVLSGFAYHVFHIDAARYGLLNTALAVGALMGALLASRRPRVRMRLLVGTAFGFGVLEAVTAFAPHYWLFAAMLTTVGLLGLTFLTSSNATIQLATEPTMRGRVMSLHMIVFIGGTPVGAPIIGWVTEQWGPRIGLLACGAISACAAAAVGWIMLRNNGLRMRVTRRGVSFVSGQNLAESSA